MTGGRARTGGRAGCLQGKKARLSALHEPEQEACGDRCDTGYRGRDTKVWQGVGCVLRVGAAS